MIFDCEDHKQYPIATGALGFFPDAIAELAHVSFVSTEQHHPGEPVHWDREKSVDDADAGLRHLMKAMVDPFARDDDGLLHSAKAFWRMGAFCQRQIEAEQALKSAIAAMDSPFYPGRCVA